jgi:hypothetical protein
MKKILFISEDAVRPGHPNGGQVCVRRHFSNLAKGDWRIYVAAPEEHQMGLSLMSAQAGLFLPRRMTDWFRSSGLMRKVAQPFLVSKVARYAKSIGADVLLTNLNRTFPILAARVARRAKVPLGVIIYDQREIWEDDSVRLSRLYGETQEVFAAASRLWFVTKELQAAYEAEGVSMAPQTASRLLPIPEGWKGGGVEWKPSYAEKCVLGFAGGLHTVEPEVLSQLGKAVDAGGHELLMILPPGREGELDPLKACRGLRTVPAFPDVRDALAYLQQQCSALLVPYAVNPPSRSMALTSFPSKLLEFSHLGLPVMVIASEETPVGRWAKEEQIATYVSGGTAESIAPVLRGLQERAFWEECRQHLGRLSQTSFSPAHIHSGFERDLEALAALRLK